MIEIADVCPNARETRAIQRGWGSLHWICIPYTYAFLFGFLIYGLVVERLVATPLPPFLLSGFILATTLLWMICAWAVRKVSAHEAKKTPTGGLPWKWTIGADGIVFANGLQTNQVDWRAVKTIRDEADRFLFLVTPAYNPVLPKRLLSEQQLVDLRNLIADVTSSGRLGRGVD